MPVLSLSCLLLSNLIRLLSLALLEVLKQKLGSLSIEARDLFGIGNSTSAAFKMIGCRFPVFWTTIKYSCCNFTNPDWERICGSKLRNESCNADIGAFFWKFSPTINENKCSYETSAAFELIGFESLILCSEALRNPVIESFPNPSKFRCSKTGNEDRGCTMFIDFPWSPAIRMRSFWLPPD